MTNTLALNLLKLISKRHDCIYMYELYVHVVIN